jgi:hypothetical protein
VTFVSFLSFCFFIYFSFLLYLFLVSFLFISHFLFRFKHRDGYFPSYDTSVAMFTVLHSPSLAPIHNHRMDLRLSLSLSLSHIAQAHRPPHRETTKSGNVAERFDVEYQQASSHTSANTAGLRSWCSYLAPLMLREVNRWCPGWSPSCI